MDHGPRSRRIQPKVCTLERSQGAFDVQNISLVVIPGLPCCPYVYGCYELLWQTAGSFRYGPFRRVPF